MVSIVKTLYNFLRIKPLTYPTVVRTTSHPNNSEPLCYIMCFVSNRHWYARASVIGLLGSCCPSTVVRLITLIVIYTLKRICMIGRFSQIFSKIFKVIPSITNFDTSTAIIMIARIIRIIAAISHPLPTTMKPVIRLTVFFKLAFGIFPSITATTLTPASNKVAFVERLYVSTITTANNILAVPIFNYLQPSKTCIHHG